jgi:hypothetical protein
VPWKVELDSERGFVHSVYSGAVTREEVWAGTTETLRITAGQGPQKFFTEWVDATSDLSTMDIFVIPDQWEAAGIDRRSMLALVVDRDGGYWEDAAFYENACRNRGWQVRVFSDRTEAIAWLQEQVVGEAK